MKVFLKLFLVAFIGLSATIGFASVKGAPFLPEVDSRFHTIENYFTGTLGVVSITATGDITGDGGDQIVGFLNNQVAASATALTIAQCGSTVVSAGAAVQPLPEASTALGCRYTFVCGTADDFDIDPADASDTILSVSTTNGTTGVVTLAPSGGDEIRCTDIGGSITLEAVGANSWAQVGGGNGIWTDVN